jgi:3-phytase
MRIYPLNSVLILFLLLNFISCTRNGSDSTLEKIEPVVVTEKVKYDTDDPAIWIHPTDKSASLIIGTDKDPDGALYVFDLNGYIIPEKTVPNLKRPNNVDVEYGLKLDGQSVDIAVTSERLTNSIRVLKVPEMVFIDNGGLPVFENQTLRAPMGIALYKRPSDGAIYAIVGRKEGPTQGYLWQYRLQDDGTGRVRAEKLREFGQWSGKKEIEAIAVDDELGFVYYSDETVGVRKYHADPDAENADQELALFATSGFKDDHEGISIYDSGNGKGYILVSDQQANEFHLYTRGGSVNDPHDHQLVQVVHLSTTESDGSEVTSVPLLPKFPKGLFVAMSDDKTFHYYSWEQFFPTN